MFDATPNHGPAQGACARKISEGLGDSSLVSAQQVIRIGEHPGAFPVLHRPERTQHVHTTIG